MSEWWSSLDSLTQWFYGAALLFSLIFLWQFVSSLIGLSGEADVDVHVDTDFDAGDLDVHDIEADSLGEAADTAAAFKVLSVRAVLAFCTLFTWAGAMYLGAGRSVARSLTYALLWGLAGWVVVALLVNWLRRLAETGTPRLATCVGTNGTIYLDIPPGGRGEVRVMVSGTVTHVKARATGDEALNAGAPIRVLRVLDHTTIEVAPISDDKTNTNAGP